MTADTITTRLATSEDRAAVEDLLDRVFPGKSDGGPLWKEVTAFEKPEWFGPYIVMTSPDGTLVGCVHVNRGGRISDLAVEPEDRRKGYGSQLVSAAEAHAREDGCESVSVSVDVEGDVLLRWYADRGYIDTGTRDRGWSPGGPCEKAILRMNLGR